MQTIARKCIDFNGENDFYFIFIYLFPPDFSEEFFITSVHGVEDDLRNNKSPKFGLTTYNISTFYTLILCVHSFPQKKTHYIMLDVHIPV